MIVDPMVVPCDVQSTPLRKKTERKYERRKPGIDRALREVEGGREG